MQSARPLTDSARKFVDNVLALKPRHAVFDCDGTLWSGDAGADFFFDKSLEFDALTDTLKNLIVHLGYSQRPSEA